MSGGWGGSVIGAATCAVMRVVEVTAAGALVTGASGAEGSSTSRLRRADFRSSFECALCLSSAGISCVPLWSRSNAGDIACRVGIDSPATAGIAVVASTALLVIGVIAPFGTAQLSVRSPSVDSYAATSSTGNSAVASLSTSGVDALVFTGGISGFPQIFFSRDSIPHMPAVGCGVFMPTRKCECVSQFCQIPLRTPYILETSRGRRWVKVALHEYRLTAPAPGLLRVPPRPTSRSQRNP